MAIEKGQMLRRPAHYDYNPAPVWQSSGRGPWGSRSEPRTSILGLVDTARIGLVEPQTAARA
jgi:hypothetical protein